MNKDSSTTLKILGITIGIVIISSLFIGNGSTDIHIHDTYFIMSSITQLIVITLSTLFLIGLVASVWTRFKNKLYVKILLFSIFLLFSFGIYIFSLFMKVK